MLNIRGIRIWPEHAGDVRLHIPNGFHASGQMHCSLSILRIHASQLSSRYRHEVETFLHHWSIMSVWIKNGIRADETGWRLATAGSEDRRTVESRKMWAGLEFNLPRDKRSGSTDLK